MGETILENKFFSAKRVTGTAIKIAGMGGENCYLVEGSERALLIDGLCGVGSLTATSITSVQPGNTGNCLSSRTIFR